MPDITSICNLCGFTASEFYEYGCYMGEKADLRRRMTDHTCSANETTDERDGN